MDQVEQKLFEIGALTTDNNAVIFYTWECIKGGFQLVPCLYNCKFLTNVTFHFTINSPKVPLREVLVHTCEPPTLSGKMTSSPSSLSTHQVISFYDIHIIILGIESI